MKYFSLLLAIFLCEIITLFLELFLLGRVPDIGFIRPLMIGDLVAYLTLMSAVTGSIFAYKILQATIDQRDANFMPFLYVVKIQFHSKGIIEIYCNNCGQGPAIGAGWEPISNSLKLKKVGPNVKVFKSNDLSVTSFCLKRECASTQTELDINDINFSFILHCKDQIGNKYNFEYLRQKNGDILFTGAQKNGRVLIA